MLKYVLVAAVFICSACSHRSTTGAGDRATASDPASPKKCTSQSDARLLEIRTKADGSCDLMYTKFGSEIAVASGGTQHCQKVRENITANLQRSGFTCE